MKAVLSEISLSSAWLAMSEGKLIPDMKKTPLKKNRRIYLIYNCSKLYFLFMGDWMKNTVLKKQLGCSD